MHLFGQQITIGWLERVWTNARCRIQVLSTNTSWTSMRGCMHAKELRLPKCYTGLNKACTLTWQSSPSSTAAERWQRRKPECKLLAWPGNRLGAKASPASTPRSAPKKADVTSPTSHPTHLMDLLILEAPEMVLLLWTWA